QAKPIRGPKLLAPKSYALRGTPLRPAKCDHTRGLRNRVDGFRIEGIHPVLIGHARLRPLPAQSEIDGEVRAHAPVVLNVAAPIGRVRADRVGLDDVGAVDLAKKECRERDTAAGGSRKSGQIRAEGEVATRRCIRVVVENARAEFDAGA